MEKLRKMKKPTRGSGPSEKQVRRRLKSLKIHPRNEKLIASACQMPPLPQILLLYPAPWRRKKGHPRTILMKERRLLHLYPDKTID